MVDCGSTERLPVAKGIRDGNQKVERVRSRMAISILRYWRQGRSMPLCLHVRGRMYKSRTTGGNNPLEVVVIDGFKNGLRPLDMLQAIYGCGT
jgi:hypothetical protein